MLYLRRSRAYTVFSLVVRRRDWLSRRPAICVFGGVAELPFYLVFAVLCALVGYLYVLVFYGLRNQLFHKLPIPRFRQTG